MAIETKSMYNLGEGLTKEMKNAVPMSIENARGV